MFDQFCRSFLTAPVFIKRAYTALESLTGKQFRGHEIPGSKKLIEEIIPIATFLKYIEIPGRKVRCKYVGHKKNYDAEIRLLGPEVDMGFFCSNYFVEVTTAVSPKDYLRREALNRYGHVWGGSDIKRIGSKKKGNDKIISEAIAEDVDKPIIDAIKWVRVCLNKKSADSYPKPCILIVNLTPGRTLIITEWAKLAKEVRGDVDRAFAKTYIVNWMHNGVFCI